MVLFFNSQWPHFFFHIQMLRMLTFVFTGTLLKVASFSPFISLGISGSGSLFGESKGNHMSPLAVLDCVDDIYACLSVLIFFSSVPSLWGVSISLSRTFSPFQSADTKVLTNDRKMFMRSPS